MSRLKKVSGLPYKIVIESEHTRFLLLTRSTSVEGYCLRIKREARKIAECTSYTSCVLLSFSSRGNIVWETQTHIHAYAHTCILTTAAAAVAAKECSRLPLPLRRLTSKHALILPLVYGHVVWLTKCISPWFHCPLSGGRRPTLYFTVFWVVGRRPTPSTEWFLKGPHLISPFTQWAACSPYLLLNDSYNTYTKMKVVSPCEVWSKM